MSEPPSYAPTATSSFTIPTTNYHEEVTKSAIIKSSGDKDVLNSLAEVYSIVTVLETIEKAFIKDYITDKEKYTSTSLRLINQYQIILKGFKEDDEKLQTCQKFIPDFTMDGFLTCFSKQFNLNCPLALKRLSSGIPVTIELMGSSNENDIPSGVMLARDSNTSTPMTPGSSGNNHNTRLIAESTGNFITCMDALKLNYNTKDQLHPLLSELVINLNELTEENSKYDFAGKSKLVNWLIKLNNLQDQELSAAEIEEFLTDLNVAYKNFYMTLE